MEQRIVMLGDMFDDGRARPKGAPQALPDFLKQVASFGRTVCARSDLHIGLPVPHDSHKEFMERVGLARVPSVDKRRVVQNGPVCVGKGGKPKRW